jgi:hypothetical protein
MVTPNAITHHFNKAHDSSPPFEGKPTDNDLLAIQETILPLLMVIPYDQLNGVNSLTAILTKAATNTALLQDQCTYIVHPGTQAKISTFFQC